MKTITKQRFIKTIFVTISLAAASQLKAQTRIITGDNDTTKTHYACHYNTDSLPNEILNSKQVLYFDNSCVLWAGTATEIESIKKQQAAAEKQKISDQVEDMFVRNKNSALIEDARTKVLDAEERRELLEAGPWIFAFSNDTFKLDSCIGDCDIKFNAMFDELLLQQERLKLLQNDKPIVSYPWVGAVSGGIGVSTKTGYGCALGTADCIMPVSGTVEYENSVCIPGHYEGYECTCDKINGECTIKVKP